MSFRHFLGFLTLFALLPPAAAAPPTWWATGNPPIITGTEANNRAPANIGQAKWMVTEALRTLDTAAPTLALQIRADLAGTAPGFTNRIIDLTVPNPKSPSWLAAQKSPLLLGQLKAISAPFYTRLAAAYPTWLTTERTTNATNLPNSIFPWTTTPDDDQNKATATLGQLKAVFSLRFESLPSSALDLDRDGIPDQWEIVNLFNSNDLSDALSDSDLDGYNNLQEFVLGTNPRSFTTLADTDGDGMPNLYETANALSISQDDSLEDKDGDRIPNIFEFKRGALANDIASKPVMTLVVDPIAGGASSSDRIFSTIREAVSEAGKYLFSGPTYLLTYPQAYATIEVKAASYPESVSLDEEPVLLLGEVGKPQGPPVILGPPDYDHTLLSVQSASVVDSFIMTHSPGRKGVGVEVYPSYNEQSNRRRLVNCVVRGNENSYGGGISNDGAMLDLAHCTVTGNKGTWQGRGIYVGGGTLNLINSIVWGNTGVATEEISKDTSGIVNTTSSIVAGGEQGGINENPQLTPAGWLKSTSPAINRSGIALASASLVDIHGEIRPVGITPDLGADEYKDNNGTADTDGLPDWAEEPDDNDGLSALNEYVTHGTNPLLADTDGDDLNDGAEVTAGSNPLDTDTDRDGMPDGRENINGLNLLVDDSLEDKDGDRIPNIFELKRGTLANLDTSKPAATFVVNPATGGNSTTDNVYATIKEALNQASQFGSHAVIEVKAGKYAEQVSLSGSPVLLLGECSIFSHLPIIQGDMAYDGASLLMQSASVVDGFVISKSSSKGVGVDSSSSYNDSSKRRRLVNCVVRGNENSYGGGISNYGAILDLVHCTVTANRGTYLGRGIYNASGTLNLVGSIVWANVGAAPQEIYKDTSGTVNVSSSVVAGGEQGGINENPQLTPAGWLKSTSPAINRSGIALAAASHVDIHGETRPVGSTPDLGADEYKDNNGTADSDGLPDWAEGPEDIDGLSALNEYMTHGTHPLIADTDGDGLNDGAEIAAGLDPLNPHEDADGDGMSSAWEILNGFNPQNPSDATLDPDADGLTNVQEFQIQSDPKVSDTDGDSLPDGWEYRHQLDPRSSAGKNGKFGDPDADGLTNIQEFQIQTDPDEPDTDGDSLPDGWEYQHQLNPKSPTGNNGQDGDPDQDGVSNFLEWQHGCDPNKKDTDDDGTADGPEINQGSDPNNAADGGQPPTPETIIEVPFRVGDPSGSHSETWCLKIIPKGPEDLRQPIKVASKDYGVMAEQTIKLRKNNKYEIVLEHLRTSPEYSEANDGKSDYDWEAQIDTKPPTRVLGASKTHTDQDRFFVVKDHWIVDNEDGLLGTVDIIFDASNNATGKKAILMPIEIQEVSFAGSNYHQLKSDDGNTIYSAPHWVDLDLDGKASTNTTSGEKNYPVSFTRNTKPEVGVKFKVAGLEGGQSLKIKADSSQGLQIPETTVSSAADGTITLPPTPASNNLANSIDFFNSGDSTAFKIDWKISIGSSEWGEVASSKHTVCVTFADPIPTISSRQETLFTLACKNAKGKLSPADITAGIWSDFTDRDVRRVDGVKLTYYGNYNCEVMTTEQLIKQGDGQCGAWARLLIDLRKVHGIDDIDELVKFAPVAASGFVIKNWAFQGNGKSGHPTFPFLNIPTANPMGANGYNWNPGEVTDAQGIAGQGNLNPASLFIYHEVAMFSGRYYDPSYGTEYTSLPIIDDSSIAGFYLVGPYPVDEMTVSRDLNGNGNQTDLAVQTHAVLFRKNLLGLDLVERRDNL